VLAHPHNRLQIYALFMFTGVFSTFLIPETNQRTLEDVSNEEQERFAAARLPPLRPAVQMTSRQGTMLSMVPRALSRDETVVAHQRLSGGSMHPRAGSTVSQEDRMASRRWSSTTVTSPRTGSVMAREDTAASRRWSSNTINNP
jgi:hypothetical protein